MDAVPIATLVLAFVSLLLGTGLLVQKRKEGEQWGALTAKVDAALVELQRLGTRLDTATTLGTQLDTVINGFRGQGGLVQEVAQLRAAKHEQSNQIHAAKGTLGEHEIRLDDHENRIENLEPPRRT